MFLPRVMLSGIHLVHFLLRIGALYPKSSAIGGHWGARFVTLSPPGPFVTALEQNQEDSVLEFPPDYEPQVPSGIFRQTQATLHLLIHPDQPRWMALNRLGLEVTELCDGTHTIRDIADVIAARYRQDADRVYTDVVVYLRQLAQAGFLLEKFHLPQEPEESSASQGFFLYLEITNRCNLHCVHCAVQAGAPRSGTLTTEEIYVLIDEATAQEGGSVYISGGEPLMREDVLDILRYARSRGRTSLATNGTLIDEAIAQDLAAMGVYVQISLDGPSPAVHDCVRGDGAFKRAMQGLDLLCQQGISDRVTLCQVVMKPNAKLAPATVRLAEEKSVGLLRFIPLQKAGRADPGWVELHATTDELLQLYTYLYRQLAQRPVQVKISGGLSGLVLRPPEGRSWCPIGRSAAIDAVGNVYPCTALMVPAFLLGNVQEQSLKEIIASEKMQNLVATIAARKEEIARCRECPWRHFCQGGCAGIVYGQKGTLMDTDGLCDLRQTLFRDILFHLAAQRRATDETLDSTFRADECII